MQEHLQSWPNSTLFYIHLFRHVDPIRWQLAVGQALRRAAVGVRVAVDGHLEGGAQLRELVHAVEAVVLGKIGAHAGAGFGVGSALGGAFGLAHGAEDQRGEARDAGADDAEAGFDAGPDRDVDGEAWR